MSNIKEAYWTYVDEMLDNSKLDDTILEEEEVNNGTM